MKNKHMNVHDRITIENGLNNNLSFKAISTTLNKDCTTISKEVRNNYISKNISSIGRIFNNCIHRFSCTNELICSPCYLKRPKVCRSCTHCRSHCDSFKEEICPKLSKPPYVCNGCLDKEKCSLTKHFYHALVANKNYQERLSD